MIAGPSVAQAATVLGQTCVTNDVAGWSEDRTPMQNTVSTGNQYTAAAPGVITSWSSQANATANRTLRLLVFRHQSGSNYLVLHKDRVRTLAVPNQLNTFTGVRFPIEAGDRLGLYVPTGQPGGVGSTAFNTGGGSANQFFQAIGEPTLGGTESLGASATNGNRLNVSAVVEPDADRDGFGDETQDRCSTSAATQGR